MKLRKKNFKKKSLFIGICLFVLNHCKWVFQFEMENNTNKFTERHTWIHAVAQHIFMSCYMCAQDKKTMYHRHFKLGTASVLCSLRYSGTPFELCMCGAVQDIFSNCQSTHSDESANAFRARGVSSMAEVCFLVTIWASLRVNSTTKLSWNILGSRLTACHICTHLATIYSRQFCPESLAQQLDACYITYYPFNSVLMTVRSEVIFHFIRNIRWPMASGADRMLKCKWHSTNARMHFLSHFGLRSETVDTWRVICKQYVQCVNSNRRQRRKCE